jgi:shikimate kinase
VARQRYRYSGRACRPQGQPPLLRGGNPREILARLRDERRPAYQQAAIHITSGNLPHGVTASRILKAIDAWL